MENNNWKIEEWLKEKQLQVCSHSQHIKYAYASKYDNVGNPLESLL